MHRAKAESLQSIPPVTVFHVVSHASCLLVCAELTAAATKRSRRGPRTATSGIDSASSVSVAPTSEYQAWLGEPVKQLQLLKTLVHLVAYPSAASVSTHVACKLLLPVAMDALETVLGMSRMKSAISTLL